MIGAALRQSRAGLPFGGRWLVGALLAVAGALALWFGWLDHLEREQLTANRARMTRLLHAILARVARLGSAGTWVGDLMRQCQLRQRPGRGAAAVFAPLRAAAQWRVEVMFFDAAGRRVAVPGFPIDKRVVSERVMRRLLLLDDLSLRQEEALSRSFFARPAALAELRESPRNVQQLVGGLRFSHVAWWPLASPHPAPVATAAGTRPGQGRAPPPAVAHVLLLVPQGALARARLLPAALARIRSRLPADFSLRSVRPESAARRRAPRANAKGTAGQTAMGVRSALGGAVRPGDRTAAAGTAGVPGGWREGPPRASEASGSDLDRPLAAQASFDDDVFLQLTAPFRPDGETRQIAFWIGVARFGGAAVATLLLLGLGRVGWFVAPERILLRSVVPLLVAAMVVPILATFVGRVLDYRDRSTHAMVWQTHRRLENALVHLDETLGLERAKVHQGLVDFVARLAAAGPASLPPFPADPAIRAPLEAAWLLDDRGRIECTFHVAGRPGNARELAVAAAVNILADLRGVRPRQIDPQALDLFFIKGFARYLSQSSGSFLDLQGFGTGRSTFIAFVHSPDHRGPVRIFIAFLDRRVLRERLLRRLLRYRLGFHLGVLECRDAGPVRSIPAALLGDADLVRLGERAAFSCQTEDELVSLPGRGRFMATAMRARQLEDAVLVGALPYQPVAEQRRRFVTWLTALTSGLLLAIVGLSWVLVDDLRGALGRVTEDLGLIRDRRFALPPAVVVGPFGRIQGGLRRAAHTLAEIFQAVPVQQTLIGRPDTRLESLEISSCHQPGSLLGTDFLDGLALPDGRMLFALGGVAGQAIPATLFLARVKVAIALLAEETTEPGALLRRLQAFLSDGVPHRLELTIGVAGPDARVTLACGGGSGPLLVESGRPSWLATETGDFGLRSWWVDGQSVPRAMAARSPGIVGQGRALLGPEGPGPIGCFEGKLSPGALLVLASRGWFEWLDPSGVGVGADEFARLAATGGEGAAGALAARFEAAISVGSSGLADPGGVRPSDRTLLVLRGKG